jgi:hypothetical protein
MAVLVADVQKIINGNVPDDKVQAAIDKATIIIDELYSECLPDPGETIYDTALCLYSAHLLYTWGFGLPKTSSAVGDVSTGKSQGVNLGDKTGLSPYFIEFQKLLNCPEDAGPYLTSI